MLHVLLLTENGRMRTRHQEERNSDIVVVVARPAAPLANYLVVQHQYLRIQQIINNMITAADLTPILPSSVVSCRHKTTTLLDLLLEDLLLVIGV